MENKVIDRHTDLTYLREIAKGSNEFIIQMLDIFIDQTPKALATIDKAFENKDWKLLRLAAHKIKPSLLFVGLKEIKDDVSLLEEYTAEEFHLEAVPALIDKIKSICTKALVELKDELKELE